MIQRLLIFLFCALSFQIPTTFSQTDTEKQVAAYLDSLKDDPASLLLFFQQMPKGGDLHYHYSGSVYAETYLAFAEKQGFFVHTDSLLIAPEPSSPRWISFAAWQQRPNFEAQYRQFLRKWSVQDFSISGQKTPSDNHFFQTFLGFSSVERSPGMLRYGLRTLQAKAKRENIQYLEIIHRNVLLGTSYELPRRKAWETFLSDSVLFISEPERKHYFDSLFQEIDVSELVRAYCDTLAAAHPSEEMPLLRYQSFALRIWDPVSVFVEMKAAFAAAAQSPLIVGTNVVGAENHPVALRDYPIHIEMLAFLREKYPEVRLTLHAGELTPELAPPHDLSYHVRDAVLRAGAERIGHGSDIACEPDAPEVLQKMAADSIPIEINLSSNQFILGIKNSEHPLRLYRRFGVPVVIGTDDEGVLRTTLAQEYVQLVQDFGLSYLKIKALVRNSIRYAFLSEAEKAKQVRELNKRFRRFEQEVRQW